jgi:FtsZ-binding cell division protein ZapB
VGELDDIKKTVRSISGTITTVQNEVKELSKKYVDLETQTQGMSNIFDNVRSECTFVSVCPCFHYSLYCVAFLRRLASNKGFQVSGLAFKTSVIK